MAEPTDTSRYSSMDLEDAEACYHDRITPEMRADGLAPAHETVIHGSNRTSQGLSSISVSPAATS